MPYTYSPRIRVTSLIGGPATVYDLSLYNWTVRAEVKDLPILTSHEMLDFSIEQTRYGSRRQVFLDFSFPTGSAANETELVSILQATLSDDNTIEISLDGGTTYREVQLDSLDAGDMEAKKIGRVITTAWTVKALQTGPVAVLGGAW